jgi:hypothetical protein
MVNAAEQTRELSEVSSAALRTPLWVKTIELQRLQFIHLGTVLESEKNNTFLHFVMIPKQNSQKLNAKMTPGEMLLVKTPTRGLLHI